MLALDQQERVPLLHNIFRTYQELQEEELKLLARGLVALEAGELDKLESINEEVIYIRLVLTDIKTYLESNYKQVVTLH